MAKLTIEISDSERNLVKAQLKTISKRFQRYAAREPHEETSGEDSYMVDASEHWLGCAAVFERMYRQL